MEFLKVLLYGEGGILHRIETGREEHVVSAEKEMLIDAARETQQKYLEGTLSNEELLIYIDAFDVFSSFQHVDWIREMTAELHSILLKDAKIFTDDDI